MIDGVAKLQESEQSFQDSFESMTERGVTASSPERPGEFESSLRELGLQERFDNLKEDQVWSAEDRALYRRLSQADFDKTESAPSPSKPNPVFFELVDEKFHDWDRNQDQRLDLSEVDFIMTGGFYDQYAEVANSPIYASTLATAQKHFDYIESAHPHDGKGMSQQDFRLLANPASANISVISELITEDFAHFHERALSQTTPANLLEESFEPGTIHQGVPGSCVLLSTLAGLTQKDIKNFFSENEQGQTVVKFADGHQEVLAEPTLSERLYHSRGQENERWPAMLEIAVAQRLYTESSGESKSLRGSIDGIEPAFALKALTGLEADQRNLDELTLIQTREALAELTQKQGPVICGSRARAVGDFIDQEDLHNGIYNGHAYTILGFDQEKDTVTLRNPWGHTEWAFQESPDDGVFEMPTAQFYSSFRWVAGTKEA